MQLSLNGGLDLSASLNPEQLEAVTHGEGPQLVLAGAGSGKTRVITYRLAWLICERHIDPSAVIAVTFTNKAASEMKRRVEEVVGRKSLDSYVGTFHRFGLRLLRRYAERAGLKPGFVILDDSDQQALVRQALKEEQLSETAFQPRTILGRISDAKSRLQTPKAMAAAAQGFFEERLARVYTRYAQLQRRVAGVDFDDLISFAVRLLQEDVEIGARVRSRVGYLLVDEFQDTNHAQLRLVHALVGAGGNLTAVGDEDQGIYRWRGADLDNILHFERSFPGAAVRKLERNYRSTQNILDAADAVVSNNEHRRGKRLWTEAGAGEPIDLYHARDEIDEARWVVDEARRLADGDVRYQDIGILVRTNAQTRALEEELLRTETPYSLVGGTRFYERAEIKDLVAYLRIVHDAGNTMAMQRVLNQPPRGIGKTTRGLVEEECDRRALSLWDYLRLDQLDSLPARAAKALRAFRDLVLGLQAEGEGKNILEVLEMVLERTDFMALFKGDDAESIGRRENIRELLSAAHGFCASQLADEVGLSHFLDHVALVSDLDGWEVERGVSVLTLHSAKGLEFHAAFLVGLEEGLLPHYNSQGGSEDLEEERRLFYVGMTRAKRRLLVSTCRRRRVAGRYQDQRPSPFLTELPESLLSVRQSPTLFQSERTQGASSFFGRRPAVELPRERGQFAAGKQVRHPTLGSGVILAAEGEGDSAKLTVFFKRSGKRKLVAKYANLEVVG